MTTANSILSAFVIKYVCGFCDEISEENVMVVLDEKEAIDETAKLNSSIVSTDFESRHYEIERLSNQPKISHTHHRNPYFVEIALRQLAHNELFRHILIDRQFKWNEELTWMEAALDNLHQRCSECPEMTIERVKEIILDEVGGVIDISRCEHFSTVYRNRAAYFDKHAADEGMRIVA
ncbi:hypothetical protein [Aeromonas media]|uniref:hypothetical protein n=1 Tax=Aeromonas media TaxID=651 RepID=UPI003D1A93FA